MSGAKYNKEFITIKCEEIVHVAKELLAGELLQGERDCLDQLVPTLNIAAELFRQVAKSEEADNGGK